jgi:LPLT family lysophospholipid transporter-like MFS transporter
MSRYVPPSHTNNKQLFSGAMIAVLAAQFLSAAADNALLFAAIGLIKVHGFPDYFASMLQEFFAGAFIFLAPFVGPFADAYSKGRVMLIANGIKLLGAGAMFLGLHPLLAYGVVGMGAAAYSPAKYGILSELVAPEQLVKANSLMEGSTIVAILLGALLGGWLADVSVQWALVTVVVLYGFAALANIRIPRLPAAHPLASFNFLILVRDFWSALKQLYRHPEARFTLLGTSLFWGTGSTLRFMLVAWVPVALAIDNNRTPANLNGVVAIGIALGAALAARLVNLKTVNRALIAGLLLGVLVWVLAGTTSLYWAAVLLVAIGASGGFFVVPLNALLQECGHKTVGAGHAIAVQNFSEGIAMLTLVGAFTAAHKAAVPVIFLAQGFGLAIIVLMGLLTLARLTRWRSTPT